MKPLVSVTLALLTSCVFVAPEARGSTILLDCTASTIPTLTNSAPSATSNITCPQFNSGFGTLTQYTLVSGAGTPQTIPTGSITIQNLTGSPISGGGGVFYTWNLSTFAGYTTPVGTDTVTGVNLGPNATGTFNFTAFSAIAIRTFPPQTAGLSSLIGNGTFQVGSIVVTTSVDPSTVGTVLSYTVNGPVDGMRIAYDFNAPEPSTLSLTAGGVLALLVALHA